MAADLRLDAPKFWESEISHFLRFVLKYLVCQKNKTPKPQNPKTPCKQNLNIMPFIIIYLKTKQKMEA